jgi:Flp pilus assembly protein CpaB
LKRSNRLILLIGFLLAAFAFVGVVMLLGSGGGGTPPDPTTSTYTVAAKDIPLGTKVTADMIETKVVSITEYPADVYTLPAEAIGQTTTDNVSTGQRIGPSTFSTVTVNPDIARLLGAGRRAMSIQVNQVDGVGMLLKAGDRVDVVVAISGMDKFPIVVTDPTTGLLTPVSGINATSVKAIIQNLEVVGTILPAPAQGATPPTGNAVPALDTGSASIVILAVSAQEAEVLRFAQIDATPITLILRSPADKEAPNEETTGITLRRLVDGWAVIPPQIVETILPKPKP